MNGIKQQKRQGYFALNVLSASLFLIAQTSHAMQVMEDQDLRTVNGQNGGLHINTTYGDGMNSGIDIDELYWQDQAGRPGTTPGEDALRASMKNIKIRDNNPNDGLPLGTEYRINMGSKGAETGLDFDIQTNHSLITMDSLQICKSTGCTASDISFGKMAINSTTPIGLHFTTKGGFLTPGATATFTLGLKNTNIYLGQKVLNSNTNLNQLILKNFNFNFDGQGKMYVDAAKGLYMETGSDGYVDFNRVPDVGAFAAPTTGAVQAVTLGSYAKNGKPENAGLNLEFMLKGNVGTSDLYTLDGNKNPQNARGLIRVGASGRMVNAYLQVRGTNTTTSLGSDNILGFANSATTPTSSVNTVLGTTGIGFRMKGEFINSTESGNGNPTTLEIGGAGLNTYGFEFSELSALISNSTARAYFDSGNVYLNLVNTQTVNLPTNYTLQNSRFGGTGTGKLTSDSDYIQKIHTGTGDNPNSVIAAVRGADFQVVSRRGRFTNSATDGLVVVPQMTEHTNNTWGLALPFHNLNMNMAMYGTEVAANSVYYYTIENDKAKRNQVGTSSTDKVQRLGFSLAMTSEGMDRANRTSAELAAVDPNDNQLIKTGETTTRKRTIAETVGQNLGSKTTSILVIDGANNSRVNKPTDYYMGIRNIDMLLKGTGSIGLEQGQVNLSLKDLLIVMAGEIAAGYLPGADYTKCPSGALRCKAPNDNFARKDDALMGVKLRLGGDMNLSIVPHNQVGSGGTGSRLTVLGELKLDALQKNTIQISDPVDGSILGLDNLTGTVGFNNALIIAPNSAGEGVVSFRTALNINPESTPSGVLRAKDMNFYPASGAAQRLGEMAITGGTLTSRFSITPR